MGQAIHYFEPIGKGPKQDTGPTVLNAVTVYHTILNHYELIEFEKDIDYQNFDRHLEELKESLIVENKELFSQKFALQLVNLKKYLRKAEIY